MSSQQREQVKQAISEAYSEQNYTFAYYLELCLRVNEAPKT